jgi:SAM-dependent methyltransferase
MAQYQSFPDAAGASRTLEKLRGLHLPEMSGRSFLDVGCNEGFFCGFAKSAGASRVLGIDHSALFIERARQRFPECEFRNQGWDVLPQEQFDVILLASALHYAEDQPALLHRLVDRLSQDGVLVLELGIVSSDRSEWISVERGIDRREFPTMPKLREVLGEYAWKWVGRSVLQSGDPVPRHVIHISRRRPLALLLMEPPAYGKSSIASKLFSQGETRIVSGDAVLAQISQRQRPASPRLSAIIEKHYSPFHLDRLIHQIFDDGAGEELVAACVEQAGGADFALDAYVPREHHASVEQHVARLGYLPVTLRWEKTGAAMAPQATLERQVAAFCAMLSSPTAPRPKGTATPVGTPGYVDELRFEENRLVVRGWAVDANGTLPARFGVRAKGTTVYADTYEALPRADVQAHLKSPHALLGFRFALKLPGVERMEDLVDDFEVFLPEGGTLRLGRAVTRLLAPSL